MGGAEHRHRYAVLIRPRGYNLSMPLLEIEIATQDMFSSKIAAQGLRGSFWVKDGSERTESLGPRPYRTLVRACHLLEVEVAPTHLV